MIHRAEILDSTNSQVYHVKGRIFQSQDQNQKAISAYKKAIRLYDENPYSKNNLAVIYMQQNEFEEAAALLERASNTT